MSAWIDYRVQMEVIKCNTIVAMETIGEMRKLNPKSKMAESQFALSHEIVVDQLKLNSKNKNTTKSNECLGKKRGKWKKIQP